MRAFFPLPVVLSSALLCSLTGAQAQSVDRAVTADSNEAQTQRTVIEDDGTRITELRVRGQTQRLTVQPKSAGWRAYEIISNDNTRAWGNAPGGSPAAAGQRVWQVLAF